MCSFQNLLLMGVLARRYLQWGIRAPQISDETRIFWGECGSTVDRHGRRRHCDAGLSAHTRTGWGAKTPKALCCSAAGWAASDGSGARRIASPQPALGGPLPSS